MPVSETYRISQMILSGPSAKVTYEGFTDIADKEFKGNKTQSFQGIVMEAVERRKKANAKK